MRDWLRIGMLNMSSNDRDLWHGWYSGCTAPGLHPIDSITENYPCLKLREVHDEQCPHGPLGKGKFYCSRQIPPALNSRNPFPRLFLGRGKPPNLYRGRFVEGHGAVK